MSPNLEADNSLQLGSLTSSDENSDSSDSDEHKATASIHSPLDEVHFDPALYESGIAIEPLYEGASVTLLQALPEAFD